MTSPSSDPVAALRATIAAAGIALHPGVPEPSLERPPRPELGDYSTNLAMLAAPLLGTPPREAAAKLAEEIEERLGDSLERIEIAGPGFLNLRMSESWMREAVAHVLAAGPRFGSDVAAPPRSVLVEFVSANPTGPLTVASGRHAAYGDSLSRVLEFAGHRVTREYYLNDAGEQVRLFGQSIAARMREIDVPEGGYEGDYVKDLGERLAAESVSPEKTEKLGRRGVELMLEAIRGTLERTRVHFDRWASERDLYESGAVEAAIETLRSSGVTYESEGALWMRTSDLGDDKDRVLIRANGDPTYFGADVAHHRNKLASGADLIIDVLGADHHGYVARMRAAVVTFGAPSDAYEALIMQLVNLIEGGERARMSKRRGEFVTLDELLDDIGVDAARFFLLQRSHDTAIDIDLELARRQSSDNPVYYVQYAHARICSIFRSPKRGAEEVVGEVPAGSLEPAERSLITRLLEFPDQVSRATHRREPHGIATYLREVAADFHGFYRDCRVIGAGPGLEPARLEVCDAARTVIATSLDLLGIEAPEEM